MWFYEKHRSVIDTFSLLKASLTRNNDDALNILLISAFLAKGEIPFLFLTQPVTGGGMSSTMARMRATYEELQRTPSEALVWLQHITTNESNYYMALETLERFCCIKRRLAPNESTYLSYSMHNVIRHWCQEALNPEDQATWTIMAAFQLSQYLQLNSVSVFSHQNYSRHVGHINGVLLNSKYASLLSYPDGPYWWQAFVAACIWARFYQQQRRFDLARLMDDVIVLYEESAYDGKWPSQRESLETLHLQTKILWEDGDFSNAIQRYKVLLQACESHLGHFDDLTTKALEELRNVQDRSKRHQHDWQKASCTIVEPDSPPRREEEDISSGGGTSGLQQFLARYSNPIVKGQPFLLQHATQMRLFEAVRWGREAVVRVLLKGGANIASYDEYGMTALRCAVFNGHDSIVRLLLEERSALPWFTKDKYISTELHWAACYGHEAVVRLLLEHGADVVAEGENGRTPLQVAAKGGHYAIVLALLEHRADVAAKDKDGWTALDFAVMEEHVAIVQLLTTYS